MNDVDLEGDGTGYSGTFRWKASKILGSMPKLTNRTRFNLNYSTWMQYLTSRCESKQPNDLLVKQIQKDLSYIDCLSTPLSICYLFEKAVSKTLSCNETTYKKITILCMGCSAKAEERVIRETNCFRELCYYFYNFQQVELWLIGPEISTTNDCFQTHRNVVESQLFTCSLYKGTSIDFFRSHPTYINKHTVVIGFNCGFGNYENNTPARFDLLLNWLPDLYFLTGTTLPVLFTCANDYADLQGEVSIMHKILGSNFILLPQENPFSYASTMIPPVSATNSNSSNEYARGNSFCYGVQGCSKDRRYKVEYTKGRQCLPEFLRLFNSDEGIPIEQTVVACRLTVDRVESEQQPSSSLSSQSTSTTSSSSLCLNSLFKNKKEPSSSLSSSEEEEGKVKEQAIIECNGSKHKVSTDAAVIDIVNNNSTILELTSINSSVNNCNSSSNSSSSSSSSSSSTAMIQSTVTTSTMPFTYTQSKSIDLKQLIICIAFMSLVAMSDVDLLISNSGLLLQLSISTVSNSNSDSSVHVYNIELDVCVQSETMQAKFSKKKNTLTVSADIIVK